MKKRLFAAFMYFFIIVGSLNAADTAFDNYIPTLTKLEILNISQTNSGYSLSFTLVANPLSTSDYNFISYSLNNNILTPLYYKWFDPDDILQTAGSIGQNAFQNGSDLTRLNIASSIINESSGYFKNILWNTPESVTVTGLSKPSVSTKGGALILTGGRTGTSGVEKTGGEVTEIYADFINNKVITSTTVAHTDSSAAMGGAIYNNGVIGNIYGDFIGNFAAGRGPLTAAYSWFDGSSNRSTTYAFSSAGGAIFIAQSGSVKNITGNFIGNSADSTYIYKLTNNANDKAFGARGGAIYIEASSYEVSSISGLFAANSAIAAQGAINMGAEGGAIFFRSSGTISLIDADFIGNYTHASGTASSLGGAIASMRRTTANNFTAQIRQINGDFIGNYVYNESDTRESAGGAIHNPNGIIGTINGNFIGNHITAAGTAETAYSLGGAISMMTSYSRIGIINGDFIGNYVKNTSSSNTAWAAGGAIFSGSLYGLSFGYPILYLTGNFIGNYVENLGSSKIALGGALYGNCDTGYGSFIIEADNKNILYHGNYTNDAIREKVYNDIFLDSYYGAGYNQTLFITARNNGTVTFDGTIEAGVANADDTAYRGSSAITYNLAAILYLRDALSPAGDKTGTINFNNYIINAGTVNVTNVTMKLGKALQDDGTYSTGRIVPGGVDPQTDFTPITTINLINAKFDIQNGYSETVKLFAWNSSTGTLSLDFDVSTLTSDKLIIEGGGATGETLMQISFIGTNNPQEPSSSDKFLVIDLTNASEKTALFKLEGNAIDIGAYEYSLLHDTDENWYLTAQHLSNTANTVSDIPAIHLGILKTGANELHKRLKDLRRNSDKEQSGLWFQTYAKHLNIDRSFEVKMNLTGVELGTDFNVALNSGKLYLGLMGGYLCASDIKIEESASYKGKGDAKVPSLGFYGSLITQNNWFFGASARYFRIDMDINNFTANTQSIVYDVDRNFIAGILEFGRTLSYETPVWAKNFLGHNSKFLLEPKTEFQYAYAPSSNHKTNTQNSIRFESTDSLTTHLALQAEYLPSGSHSKWSTFIELRTFYEWLGKTDVNYAQTKLKTDAGDWGFVSALGVSVPVSKSVSFYSDLSYELGSVFKTAAANLGIRYNF